MPDLLTNNIRLTSLVLDLVLCLMGAGAAQTDDVAVYHI
jgi:hypothetical protein